MLRTLDLRGIGGHRDGESGPSSPVCAPLARPATPHVTGGEESAKGEANGKGKERAAAPARGGTGDGILRRHRHSFAVLAQEHDARTLDLMVMVLRNETGARTVDWGTIMGQRYFWLDTSLEVGRTEDRWRVPAMVQALLDRGEEVCLTDGSRVRFPPFAFYSRRLHDIRRLDLMMHDAAIGALRTQFSETDLNAQRWAHPDDVEVFIDQARCLDAQHQKARTPRARRLVGRRANVSIHPLIDREYKLYRRIWKNGTRRPEEVPPKQLRQWIKLQKEIALKWP